MTDFPMVVTGGPWHERIGLRCRDVTADLDPGIYPRHGLGRHELIVLIENDPWAHLGSYSERWTCALAAANVTDGDER